MPKRVTGLTAAQVKGLKKSGDYADGNGLYLRITKTGMKTWIFRFSLNGRRRHMGLGSVDLVTLAAARKKAFEAKLKVNNGIDPIDERRSQSNGNSITFSEAVSRYVDVMKSGWSNEKYAKQWQSSINTYCQNIAPIPIDKVDSAMVLTSIEPIWSEKTETASRLIGKIESILDWAKVNGHRSGDNPARWKGHLSQSLPAKSKVAKVKGHASMPYKEVPVFFPRLMLMKGFGSRALQFLILTSCRTSEVLKASWSEFNDDLSVWIIPPERMKVGKEHRIPLTEQATNILKPLAEFRSSDLVFPSQKRGQSLSNMTMANVLKRMGQEITAHGFRSSFRTWAIEETQHSHEVAEAALAHTPRDKVVAAYQRGDLFEKRRLLMQDWSEFVCGDTYESR